MSKLIIIFFIIIILIFEFFFFQFSLEIGVVSLILIITTFCIGFVINKITTVVEQTSLVFSSETFSDKTKQKKNKTKSDTEKTSVSDNLIPGVDSSIFEQFREKFNLKQTESAYEDKKVDTENSTNSTSIAKAYKQVESSDEPENFDEELEDADQVKVTLSENVKILKELQGGMADEASNENFTEEQESSLSDEVGNIKKLGTGEEALELLTKKHQALKKQNEGELLETEINDEDDLFADEFVQLPGGENLIEEEKEEIIEEDIFPPPIDNESYEDEEGLELSLRQSTHPGEKSDAAEGLLKLATKACEVGRMEEAKAGLKS